MFELKAIIKYFKDINNMASTMTIISFILLISSAYIICTYKNKCSDKYNIPAEYFEVDVVSKFSLIALIIFLAILLIFIKPLEGIQYYFARVVCYFLVSLLFIIVLDKNDVVHWIKKNILIVHY